MFRNILHKRPVFKNIAWSKNLSTRASREDHICWKTFWASTFGSISCSLIILHYVGMQLDYGEKLIEDESKKELIKKRALEITKYKPTDIPDKNLIKSHDVSEAYKAILQSNYTGVVVVGAPSGAGKSTYLRQACKELSNTKNMSTKDVYSCHGLDRTFLESIGVPSYAQISDFLPKGSIIVFEQIHITADLFSSEDKQFIIKLATQSRNSKKFQVIFLVSDPVVFRQILELNGKDKIIPGFNSSLFKWDDSKMSLLIESYYPNWSKELKNKFVEAYKDGQCAGLLLSAIDRYHVKPNAEFDAAFAKDMCAMKKETWYEFEKVCKKYPSLM